MKVQDVLIRVVSEIEERGNARTANAIPYFA